MADTGTINNAPGLSGKEGNVRKVVVDWTSDASGDFEMAMTFPLVGLITRLMTIPHATAPTDDYDVTWEDEEGEDMLQGLGVNRDTANTENVAIELANGSPVPVAEGSHTVKVANAGNAKRGKAIIYLR